MRAIDFGGVFKAQFRDERETKAMLADSTRARIDHFIQNNKIVLFMKGTPEFPQCGFSARVVAMLDELGAPFTAVDVLSDEEIRQGIKEFSQWPTIPQLYVGKKFIGGCDIAMEMYENGELKDLLEGV